MTVKRVLTSSDRGSVLITGLLLSMALLMVIGAAVDVGHAFIVRRELVSIADNAALAGSQALDDEALHVGTLELDAPAARSAALRSVASAPGQSAGATASSSTVRVDVRREFPTILLRLVGVSTLHVSAHATAEPRRP